MSVKVTGLNHLLWGLQRLGTPELIEPSLRDAVREGAEVIRDEVQELVPISTNRWTGTEKGTSLPEGALKEGLIVSEWTTREGYAAATVKFTREAPKKGGVSPNEVARWVEFGHRLVRGGQSKVTVTGKTRGKGKEVGFVPAHPFFRPAVDGTEDAVKRTVREKLKAAVDKVRKG